MEWALRAIGGFYVVAGGAALWQAAVNWRLERAFSVLLETPPEERAADIVLAVGAGLVLGSGVALLLLHAMAVPAFLASWLVQAGYLLWARYRLRPADPVAARGRRQTVHAFTLYTAVTCLVLWLPHAGLVR